MTAAVAEFLEATYDAESTEQVWIERLCDLFGPATGLRRAASSAITYELSGDARVLARCIVQNQRLSALVEDTGRSPLKTIEWVNALPNREALLDKTYGALQPRLNIVSELPSPLRDAVGDALPAGYQAIGLFARAGQRHGLHVGGLVPGSIRLGGGHKAHLQRLVKHLRVSLGLRVGELAHEEPIAVFATDGQLKHLSFEAHQRPGLAERLRATALGAERARCRTKRHSAEEALEAWNAIVDGEYSIVDSVERSGRRQLVAVRVSSRGRPLSPDEAAVVREVARGHSNKRVGDTLGMSANAAAICLGRAMRKLGCPDRSTLIRWFGGAT